MPETRSLPALNGSVGVQGVGIGNPGYSLSFEKNVAGVGVQFNAYAGLGWRANEGHSHLIGGLKTALGGGFSLGTQFDGHQHNWFTVFERAGLLYGLYLIDGKTPSFLFGARF